MDMERRVDVGDDVSLSLPSTSWQVNRDCAHTTDRTLFDAPQRIEWNSFLGH